MFGMKGNALILIFIKGRCVNLVFLINLCSNLGQCDISIYEQGPGEFTIVVDYST